MTDIAVCLRCQTAFEHPTDIHPDVCGKCETKLDRFQFDLWAGHYSHNRTLQNAVRGELATYGWALVDGDGGNQPSSAIKRD